MSGGEEDGQSKMRPHSHLFTVRLWDEEIGDGQTVWRGKVQHVLTGETRPFRNWIALTEVIRAMLPQTILTHPQQATVDAEPEAQMHNAPSDVELSIEKEAPK